MTTYTGPTPYDAEIEALRIPSYGGGDAQTQLWELALKAEGYRQGYADAKTEDAPLLEVLHKLTSSQPCILGWHRWREEGLAAIAEATRKE